MIRKCQRLSRMAHTPGTAPTAFRIVHAPADFRLKEMERWLRDQEPRTKSTKEVRRQPSAETTNTQSQSSQIAYTHAQSSRSPRTPRIPTSPTPAQRGSSTRAPGNVRRHGSSSSRSSNYVESRASAESLRPRPSILPQVVPPHMPYLSPVVEERTESPPPPNIVLPNPYGDMPQRTVEESAFTDAGAAVRAGVVSPDPLPHLYRQPNMLAPMGELVGAMMVGSPPEPIANPAEPPLPLGMPEPFVESFVPTEPMTPGMPESAPPLDPDQPVAGPSRRPLVRRRSSLKQNGGRSSANGTPKMVSWADHLTRFDHIIYAAEFAGPSSPPPSLSHASCWVLTSCLGSELEEARKRFQEEISGVQNLRSTITGALERLRLESDTLHREDAALRLHEERVVASFERLKVKEADYKERGKKNIIQPFLYTTFSSDFFFFFFLFRA